MTQKSDSNPTAALVEVAKIIEIELDTCIKKCNLPQHLEEAASYAVVNGGKRVRPTLTLLCSEAVGGTLDQAMPSAIAVELIHCFSLVHDDLPAIDNDALRRGKPTLHVKSGEAMAILAGDLLLPVAFSQLICEQYSNEQQARLTQLLATATSNMVVGQVYDTLGGLPEHLDALQQLEEIHHNKTGALIRSACQMGAVCGNASPEEFEAISTFGSAIGLMFQIVDDLIDLHGSAELVGKATGKDEEAGKTTYPGTIGVEASKLAVKDLQKKAETAISSLNSDAETLSSFNVWMAQRTR
ncbi:MAG: polyprenyl synthetase family protein [Phycisphaerae bacterium]|nr:polyprenyl synthetase family protein [Phycisphaerae bacterium]MBT5366179.1 polyprenyl synthetase family protein [Phycisphaerae bacterium]MBT6269741.1 polyprenyl synthetase family protein [Phycisphaerae bacterium]